MSDSIYWIWLSLCCGSASRIYTSLIDRFGSAYNVFRASDSEIKQIDKIKDAQAAKLCRKNLDEARAVVDACSVQNIGIITYDSPKYPVRLKQLRDAPAVLYYRGSFCDFDKNVCIAVVGTRKMSEYGKKSAYNMAYDLTAGGAVVVSGMALGVDGMAAAGAIDANGKTVAVLGCGVDIAYPAEHLLLSNNIIVNGVVISEYPPGTKPDRRNFPERNRIISGLCQGTLVIEADMRSGSLITARCAMFQGRELFALPGMVGVSNSEGTNMLLKNGARIATCAEDILELYQFLYPSKINIQALRSAGHGNVQSAAEKLNIGATAPLSERAAVKSAGTVKTPENNRKSSNISKSINTINKTGTKSGEKNLPDENISDILRTLDDCSVKVYSCMPEENPATIDEIIRFGFKVHEVTSALTMLEISGLVTALPGGQYIKITPGEKM